MYMFKFKFNAGFLFLATNDYVDSISEQNVIDYCSFALFKMFSTSTDLKATDVKSSKLKHFSFYVEVLHVLHD